MLYIRHTGAICIDMHKSDCRMDSNTDSATNIKGSCFLFTPLDPIFNMKSSVFGAVLFVVAIVIQGSVAEPVDRDTYIRYAVDCQGRSTETCTEVSYCLVYGGMQHAESSLCLYVYVLSI